GSDRNACRKSCSSEQLREDHDAERPFVNPFPHRFCIGFNLLEICIFRLHLTIPFRTACMMALLRLPTVFEHLRVTSLRCACSPNDLQLVTSFSIARRWLVRGNRDAAKRSCLLLYQNKKEPPLESPF